MKRWFFALALIGVLLQLSSCSSIAPSDSAEIAESSEAGNAGLADRAANYYGPNRAPAAETSGSPFLFAPEMDELWIVETDGARRALHDNLALGELRTQFGDTTVRLPLTHVDVSGTVYGSTALLTIDQRFRNPFDRPVDALYRFALPPDATVTDFVLAVGERRIRGVLRTREEAATLYAQARAAGLTASIITEVQPNLFSQELAHLPPGELAVELTYFDQLPYRDGAYRLAVPLRVPTEPDAGTGTEANVASALPPAAAAVPVTVDLRVDAPFAIDRFHSPSHPVTVHSRDLRTATVSLDPEQGAPNRDFILELTPAEPRNSVLAGLQTHRDREGSWFELTLALPPNPRSVSALPIEWIVIWDAMTDAAMHERARSTLRSWSERLRPADVGRLAVVGRASLAEEEPRDRDALLRAIEATTGFMEPASNPSLAMVLRHMLARPSAPTHRRVVLLVTDGRFREKPLLETLQEDLDLGGLDVFLVDREGPRGAVEAVARAGKGCAVRVDAAGPAARVLDRYFDRRRSLALTNPTVEFSVPVTDVTRSRIPDLEAGRSITVRGRYRGTTLHARIRGQLGGSDFDEGVPAPERVNRRSIAVGWATSQLQVLAGLPASAGRESSAQRLALAHGIVTPWTAFLVVDARSGAEPARMEASENARR